MATPHVSERPKVTVIGAGIGGLATALRLAAAGCAVTVLERHAAPGGKMRTVPSAAGPVDAGPTVLTMRHVFDDLFAAAGTRLEDHVSLIPQTILARHWWPDGGTLDLHANPEASADAVRAFAGARAEAEFRAFSARAERLFAAFDAPMMRAAKPAPLALTGHVLRRPRLVPDMAPLSTLAQTLARQFSDPRLAQLFGRYATYLGGSPYQSPAVLSLIWQAEAGGVWCVKGGMHALARAIADLAVRLGASFHYNAHVERIDIQNGAVRAVQLEDGTALAADHVVFNGDPRALATAELGPDTAPVAPQTRTDARSYSAQVWSFAAKAEGPELVHHNVFFSGTRQAEFDDLRAGRVPRDPTIYICAEDRGQAEPPPGTERFEIILNAPPLTTPDPKAEEFAPCLTRTFRTLDRFGLRFGPDPGPEALTTPAIFNRMFPASAGSLYGQSPHGMTAAFRRPTARTAVRGLYLAGGGAHPGAGVPMATLSGRHAAEAILSDLSSTSTFRQTATPGGMSTGSATTAPAPFPSSGS